MEPYQKVIGQSISIYYSENKLQTVVVLKNLPSPCKYILMANFKKEDHKINSLIGNIYECYFQVDTVNTFNEIVQQFKKFNPDFKLIIICTNVELLIDLQLTQNIPNQDKIHQICFTSACQYAKQRFQEQQIISNLMNEKSSITEKLCISSLDEILQKINCTQKKQYLPNFLFFIEDNMKSMCLKSALNLMIKQKFNNRIMADRMKQYMRVESVEEDLINAMMKKMQKNNYSLPKGISIYYYTLQANIYKVVNNLLRKTSDPAQLFYIQPYIKGLYEDIKSECAKKVRNYRWMKCFKCYRGAKFSKEELKLFGENLNRCIESLGFLSTSLDKDVPYDFNPNTILTISVNNFKNGKEIGHGYDYIAKQSSNPKQKQVLFNMLNSFVIRSVSYNPENQIIYIDLQYGAVQMINDKFQKRDKVMNEEQQRIQSSYQLYKYCQNQILYQGMLYQFSNYNKDYKNREFHNEVQRRIIKQNPNDIVNMLFYTGNLETKCFIMSKKSKQESLNFFKELEQQEQQSQNNDSLGPEIQFFRIWSLRYGRAYILSQNKYFQNVLQLTDGLLQKTVSFKSNYVDQRKLGMMVAKLLKLRYKAYIQLQKFDQLDLQVSKMNEISHKYPQLNRFVKRFAKDSCFYLEKDQQQIARKGNNCMNRYQQIIKNDPVLFDSLLKYGLNVASTNKTKKSYALIKLAAQVLKAQQIYKQKGICFQLDKKYQIIQQKFADMPASLKQQPQFCISLAQLAEIYWLTQNYGKSKQKIEYFLDIRMNDKDGICYDRWLVECLLLLCQLLIRQNDIKGCIDAREILLELQKQKLNAGQNYDQTIKKGLRQIQKYQFWKQLLEQNPADSLMSEMLNQYNQQQRKEAQQILRVLKNKDRDDCIKSTSSPPSVPRSAQTAPRSAVSVPINIQPNPRNSNNIPRTTQPDLTLNNPETHSPPIEKPSPSASPKLTETTQKSQISPQIKKIIKTVSQCFQYLKQENYDGIRNILKNVDKSCLQQVTTKDNILLRAILIFFAGICRQNQGKQKQTCQQFKNCYSILGTDPLQFFEIRMDLSEYLDIINQKKNKQQNQHISQQKHNKIQPIPENTTIQPVEDHQQQISHINTEQSSYGISQSQLLRQMQKIVMAESFQINKGEKCCQIF